MTTTEAVLTADDTHAAISERWQDYVPGRTEQELGIMATTLDQVRLDRLRVMGGHKLLVLNETVQPANNFKYNGMAFALQRKLDANPDLRTLYIGSAGNAGAALVAAARYRNGGLPEDAAATQGLKVVVETPDTLVHSKRQLLTAPDSTVNAVHPSVEEATATAMDKAADDPDGLFLHAYDDPDAIAGQGLAAQRAFRSLLQLNAQGTVNLERDRVKVLVQRGGGSLLTGFACALYDLKQQGLLGDNVELYQVRPDESVERYDGLHVSSPGRHAESIIADPRFVAGSVMVNDMHTSRAANAIGHTYYRPFEPSGLAGVAGFYKEHQIDDPTVYISVVTGANYSRESYEYFRDIPRMQQAKILGSLATHSKSHEESLDQPCSPAVNWRPEPKFYGRYPASR